MNYIKYRVVACIPTKNTSWLLKETLNHLSTFCYKIIISDDQSTDDTQEVCSNYSAVDYHKRPFRDFGDRQGGLQRQELLEMAYEYDPDYFFFLDADEMPSPDIINWINSLDTRQNEKINLWTFPWVHLWKDINHYRVDSYTAGNGSQIHWDPFTTTYRKGFFVRNIPNYTFKYDAKQHRVRPSNQPANVPKPWVDIQEDPVIIHYGKVSDYWNDGENWKDRAAWDKYEKGINTNDTIRHHKVSNAENTLQLNDVNKKWFWK